MASTSGVKFPKGQFSLRERLNAKARERRILADSRLVTPGRKGAIRSQTFADAYRRLPNRDKLSVLEQRGDAAHNRIRELHELRLERVRAQPARAAKRETNHQIITAKRLNGQLPAKGLTTQYTMKADKRGFYTYNIQVMFWVEGDSNPHFSTVWRSNMRPITDEQLQRLWQSDNSPTDPGSDPTHTDATKAVVMLYGGGYQ